MKTHHEALKEAIKVMGSQAALARAVGKQQGHVWFWLKEAKKLSPSIAIKIEHATDGKVSRHDLCPELSPEFKP
jgi:DNA-binding transcriptional regulator YdaS (Cro superfamily)